MSIIDQNELATAHYDEEHCIIYFQTNSILANKNIDKIAGLLQSAIKIADKFPVIGEIVDVTNLRGNFNGIIENLTNVYYPQMKKRGMKKAAYIVSKDSLSLSLVEKIIVENRVLETKAFNNIDDAFQWITKEK